MNQQFAKFGEISFSTFLSLVQEYIPAEKKICEGKNNWIYTKLELNTND